MKKKLLNILTQLGGLLAFVAGYCLAEKLDEMRSSKGA